MGKGMIKMKLMARSLMFSMVSVGIHGYIMAQEKPNIVLFYMDDMGFGDFVSNGAIGYQTPNIEKIAADGMCFTQYYSPSPVSSASRAGLLTGCYPERAGIKGVLFPNSKTGLNLDYQIIPEVLSQAGYYSCIIGKWHLGDAEKFMPLNQGFDEFFGLPYSNDMWPYNERTRKDGNTSVVKPNVPPLKLYNGNKAVKEIKTMDDQDELTTMYTQRAVRFIEENHKTPFFLYMAHSMPHIPLAVSSKFRGKSDIGVYGDVMMELDWSIGEVMKALEKYDIDENTLVIITSDNGPWIRYGEHSGTSAGLREGKMTCFEGGQRVPCLMKWPSVIPAGKICNKLASSIDLLPTFCDILQLPLPEYKIDGVSIYSLLKGNLGSTPRRIFYYFYYGLRAVRNERFKLVFDHTGLSYTTALPGRNGTAGKQPAKMEYEKMLYDLRWDAGERYDVKDMYPGIVLELEDKADSLRLDLKEVVESDSK